MEKTSKLTSKSIKPHPQVPHPRGACLEVGWRPLGSVLKHWLLLALSPGAWSSPSRNADSSPSSEPSQRIPSLENQDVTRAKAHFPCLNVTWVSVAFRRALEDRPGSWAVRHSHSQDRECFAPCTVLLLRTEPSWGRLSPAPGAAQAGGLPDGF